MVEKYIFALSIVGLVDAISYMVVAPSVIFYVLELGGTKEQYGVILSAFSFASFCAKPFLGRWCDITGYRIPYIFSLTVAASGGLLYLLASLTTGSIAIAIVLIGRLLGGVGAASSALGYAYLAKVVPNDQQTKVNSLLSMLRIGGMAAGPGVNVFLDKIDFSIGKLHLDPLNSVGLILFSMNLVGLASIVLLLDEPPRDETSKREESQTGEAETEPSIWTLLRTCGCAEILVPILSIFGFNANFQLIETGFAPAAYHALGWGPIETSAVLGSISIVIFVVMMLVFQLSSRKVTDSSLCTFGLCLSIVGYGLVYFMWVMNAPVWHFVLPMMLGCASFPFLGAPTRSLFTAAVDSKPSLAEYGGTMQAVLSMSASVAGFVTPGLVARFVLRSPEQVEASRNHRELSTLALFAPILSLSTLAGMAYIHWKHEHQGIPGAGVELGDKTEADERTSLLSATASSASNANAEAKRHSCPEASSQRWSVHTEARRRESACLMGFPQTSMMYEHAGEGNDEDES